VFAGSVLNNGENAALRASDFIEDARPFRRLHSSEVSRDWQNATVAD
jgi:hypothetical protein